MKESELPEEKQEEIKKYRAKIHDIKHEGSFKGVYVMVRKGTVDIMKSDAEELEKRRLLKELLLKCSKSIEV